MTEREEGLRILRSMSVADLICLTNLPTEDWKAILAEKALTLRLMTPAEVAELKSRSSH